MATLEHAMGFYREARLDEAAAACRALLEHELDNADALQLLGAASAPLGHADQVVEALQRAIQLVPDATESPTPGDLRTRSCRH